PPDAVQNGFPFFSTPAGDLQENTQVPFVGLYSAFTKGNFFLDSQVRWDFYRNKLTDPNNGLSGQSLNAQGFSITGNTGYHFPLHNNWFIEPSVGAVFSTVSVDPLNVGGLTTTNPGIVNYPYARGFVTVDDIESLLGRASISVGTSFTTGQVTWQPYAT